MVVCGWKDKTSGQISLDSATQVCTDRPNIQAVDMIEAVIQNSRSALASSADIATL